MNSNRCRERQDQQRETGMGMSSKLVGNTTELWRETKEKRSDKRRSRKIREMHGLQIVRKYLLERRCKTNSEKAR